MEFESFRIDSFFDSKILFPPLFVVDIDAIDKARLIAMSVILSRSRTDEENDIEEEEEEEDDEEEGNLLCDFEESPEDEEEEEEEDVAPTPDDEN